jgi:hypothetical protein
LGDQKLKEKTLAKNFFSIIFSLLDPDPDCESGCGSRDTNESGSGYGSGSITVGISILHFVPKN